MQDYNPLLPTGLISDDRQTINDNMESIITDFSGTAFPTNNLYAGMKCNRTDQSKVYQLQADLATWKQIYDYSGTEITVPKANKAVLDVDGNPINTTYLKSVPVYTGATTTAAGTAGLVKAPEITDREKFLKGNGEWAEVPKLTKLDLLDMIYPVGSIYMSVNSSNPGSLFGGTWEKMPAGRVLIPEGESDWGTEYEAGSTGGEATHTLTVDELPQHSHNFAANTISYSQLAEVAYQNSSGAADSTTVPANGWSGWVWTGDHTDGGGDGMNRYRNAQSTASTGGTIGNIGSNKAHQNMSPFIVVYCWKRVA